MRTTLAILIGSMLLISTHGQAAAQEQSVNLDAVTAYVPTIGDLVTLTKDGVNLRQEPSISAQRLMYIIDDSEEEYAELTWGDKANARLKPQPTYAGELFRVIDSVDGWYKVDYEYHHSHWPVWVSAEFCKVGKHTPITLSTMPQTPEEDARLSVRQGGKYDGLAIYLYQIMDEGEPEGIYVGRVVDGVLVLPLYFEGSYRMTDSDRFSIEENPTVLYYPERYQKFYQPDFSKMTDADVSELLDKCAACTDGSELCVYLFNGSYVQEWLQESEYGKYRKIDLSFDTKAKESADNSPQSGVVPDSNPSFPGGYSEMFKIIAKNQRYPEPALLRGVSERITVRFLVEKDGSIGNVKVDKGKDPDLCAEAIRVVKCLPKFNPAIKDGQPVSCWFTVPITFKLNY